MSYLQKPVLIYVSKEQCPACVEFARDKQWEQVKRTIGDHNATFVKFHVNPHGSKPEFIPDVLTKKDYYYPMFILAAPNSYYTFFTPDDKINPEGWTPGNKVKGVRFAVVDDPQGGGKFTWSGRSANAENIVSWFQKSAPKVIQMDDPPRFRSSSSKQVRFSDSQNSSGRS